MELKKGQWFLALKMIDRVDILIPVIGFVLSFIWLFSAFEIGGEIYHVYTEPAVIRGDSQGSITEIMQYVSEMEYVENITALAETSVMMQWDNYSGAVTVYGVDENYFNWLVQNNLSSQVPHSEGMAYGVVTESAAAMLKKDRSASSVSKTDGAPKFLEIGRDDLLQDFTLGDENVRLLAIVEDENKSDTDKNDIDKATEIDPEAKSGIPSGVYLSETCYKKLFQVEDDTTGDMVSFMVNVKHGSDIEKVKEKIMPAGVNVTDEISEMLDGQKEKISQKLYTGIIIFIVSLCVLIYQGKLWDEKHPYFIDDICRFYKDKKAFRAIKRKKTVIVICIAIIFAIWIL